MERAYFVICSLPNLEGCDVFKYYEDEYSHAKTYYNECRLNSKYVYVQFVDGIIHAKNKALV